MAARSPAIPSVWRVLWTGLTMVSFLLTGGNFAYAGDILRGGNAVTSAKRNATARSQANAEQAALAGANAKDRLARTTQAVQAVRAMQASAGAAGSGRTVPDGLQTGGLKVATGANALWTGASQPTQSGNTVVIEQTKSQAMLHWETFNVGRNTTLKFDQSAGKADSSKWIAFNKVLDPSGAPSQILGSIKADGQVYVLNQNGIIFGAGSQVNARSLVASSLPINDNLVERGLLNNPDSQFLFSALTVSAGPKGPTPAFNPAAPLTGNGVIGDVIVEKGAVLSAPTTPEKVGGRIALIGPNVQNSGTILTPDGQTILAAGLQVGFVAHPSADPSLRGVDVFVGSVTYPVPANKPPVGTATNLGIIEVARGNVTMIGKAVQQLSIIESSTSTALNGRVDLLADYGAAAVDTLDPSKGVIFVNKQSGTVKLGPDSLIRILPEWEGTDQAAGLKLALPSLINIQGQGIHLAKNSTIFAPGASLPTGADAVTPLDAVGVGLTAGVTIEAGTWVSSDNTKFIRKFTGGQIYFDEGASIYVAGSGGISVPVTKNILTLQLRGAELANSPLQRNSILRGPSITVDLRKTGAYNGYAWLGTPLGDVSGYVGIIQRGVGELTTAGGTVDLSAGEAVIMQAGSEIDVSGGWIDYQGGLVKTTRLLQKGRLVNIANAAPDQIYDGIYEGASTQTHAKWGVTKKFANALAMTGEHYEAGYIQGADAGTLTINAPSMALDGTLTGRTLDGTRQEGSSAVTMAKKGTLNLAFRGDEISDPFLAYSPSPPKIVFANNTTLAAAAPYSLRANGTPPELDVARKSTVILSPTLLTESGFGTLSIDNSDGEIVVPQETHLAAPLLGSITLRAANLTIEGSVSAPGGSLSFSVFDVSPFAVAKLKTGDPTPPLDPTRGIFTLGSTSLLSTAGLITDYRQTALDPAYGPPVIAGGSIAINAFTAYLEAGSEIDVSGGLSITEKGKRTFGAGGSIAINAGRDPGLAWLLGGGLTLESTLKGYSGVKGGSLTIQAPMIQIGNAPPIAGIVQGEDTPSYLFGTTKVRQDELLYLTPEFFTKGGFANYTLNGIGKTIDVTLSQFLPAVVIEAGTVIKPVTESWLAEAGAGSTSLRPYLKPEGVRTPTSVAFGASVLQDDLANETTTVMRGDIVMREGALIQTDPRASVAFRGGTVAILGSIMAPGGAITISGANSFAIHKPGDPSTEFNRALPTVHLGPRSVLSAAGRLVLTPDAYGRRTGTVLPGGTITVSGNIVAEAGALLDVSGATGILDLAPATLVQNIATASPPAPVNSGLTAPLHSLYTIPTRVDSDGGLIDLRGGQELFTDATLLGFAGGPAARGGSLSISSGRFIDRKNGVQANALDNNLVVTQSGPTLPAGFYPEGGTAIGHAVPGEDGTLGRGHFAVSSFAEGGFDALKLSGLGSSGNTGAVQFSGPVSISARRSLSIGDGGVIYADAAVYLEAPYVALGTPFQAPVLANQTSNLSLGGNYVLPTYGMGDLTVRASLIDIGNLSLQNIGNATFIADGGDIRGNGTFNMVGNATFQAGQIYPTTASQFTISAYDRYVIVKTSAVNSNQVTLASATLPLGFGVGSPLLGSSVTAINGTVVTLAANANKVISEEAMVAFAPGESSVTILGSGHRALPLSAGGTLNVYASNITQGGTLRAPLGTINLGWDGTGTRPIDYLSGAGLTTGRDLPVTQNLTLAGGSVTSVSAVDPLTELGIVIPYGFSSNGLSWIDPTGVDIVAGLVPGKGVNTSALNLADQAGSVIDVRGGGDLFASRWVTGLGGTNDILGSASVSWSKGTSYQAGQLVSYGGSTWSARQSNVTSAPTVGQDWTLIPESFAVIPGYQAEYAPYSPFNNRPDSLNLAAGDPGYVNANLSVGDRIYLGGSSSLAAGYYTLLPARYALLPGAVLVTPKTGAAMGTVLQPEGSNIVSGYRYNDLNAQQQAPSQATRFEVASTEVFRARAQYDGYLANTFLKESALDLGLTMPRLPEDSGHIVLSGLNSLQLDGDILGKAIGRGYGAEIDISTQADILITGSGGTGPAGTVVLSAAKLNSFGADSLLIGGIRRTTANGTSITVNTGNLLVDNAGTPLSGSEIILVARDTLTLTDGAQIVQSGTTRGGSLDDDTPLLIGDSAVAGSGNGLLLRVSDYQAPVLRSGVTSQAAQAALAAPPTMTIGAGAAISGNAVTLDSTYGTRLDPTATILARNIALNSGQIVLEFDNPGIVPTIPGLTLFGAALQSLQGASALSLLSYSSIDLYGTGTFGALGSLALRAAQIRGFNNGGGMVTFTAPEIILDNSGSGIALGSSGVATGGLALEAGTIRLGDGQLRIDQFATLTLNATRGVMATGTGGLTTQGSMTIDAPIITAAQAVNYAVTSNGAMEILSSGSGAGDLSGGLGATLSFTGSNLSVNTDILLASGALNLKATTGNLLIGNLSATRLDVSGTERVFNDITRYTNGGLINLSANQGSVHLGTQSQVSVAAHAGGGDAGGLAISAANGSFTLDGSVDGRGGLGGHSGSFALDVKSLPNTSAIDQDLNAASFGWSRTIRVRTGDVLVDGLATASTYQLSADQGSITVGSAGNIDATGITGGRIELSAFGDVRLLSGAQLSVAAQNFNSAGQGGVISLEAGSQRNGVVGPGAVDLQAGATLDLSVASKVAINPATDAFTPGTSAYNGQFSGKLHIRAPQNAAGTDLLVNPISSTIIGASSVLVEGYRLYDLTGTNGTITKAIQTSIKTDGENFLGVAGATTAGYTAMMTRLLGSDPQGLSSIFVLAPGAEIINRNGNLVLGATNSDANSDWDLSTFRFGEKSAAGVLTMKASGDLKFYNALSDGFTAAGGLLYRAELTAQNPLLPINTQSWSYRLTAGADLSAADFRRVQSLDVLAANLGSLQLGKIITSDNGNPTAPGGNNGAQTSAALAGRYQVIRTGSGDIDISAGRDVQLLNQFATIYTAGTRTADPTLGGNFQIPPSVVIGTQGNLGSVQQNPTYAAQYSMGGGNVMINAQQDIKHQTQRGGVLVADSQKQIPNNWLYRRGYVNPATGEFGVTRDGDIASTTWWVDFSNFFQGVGALGGGNVTLVAGNDISNVDAVAPTNARMTFQTDTGDRLASSQTMLELGGGDVTVRAGRNIDAGIYYVERGRGTLEAGKDIITNNTRTASLGTLGSPADFNPSSAQWLPTTLFLGKGGFDVSANGNVLLGPTVNPFLLPGGINNSFWRKSYFSTYGPSSEVNVTSLGGTVTLRQNSTAAGLTDDAPILSNWLEKVHLLTGTTESVATRQPWLRLYETDLQPFQTAFTLLPGTVRATAFSDDINLVGTFNLSPSPTGTIELVANGAINGLQPTGITSNDSTGRVAKTIWRAATINLSDANPGAIPGIHTPFGYPVRAAGTANRTVTNFLSFLDAQFAESGSTAGLQAVIQTQQALHGSSLLHADDPEPLRLYAGNGNISGLTLFSSKAANIIAGQDITDIALYIQNTKDSDVSLISAGRDIIAYNANSLLRSAAQAPGNQLNDGEMPSAGDLQISGPGTLAVLAGRNLDLGVGSNNPDGTGVGLTSIGNARNPNLPFNGADIIAGAGIGPISSLQDGTMNFDDFLSEVLSGPNAERYLAEVEASHPELLNGGTIESLTPALKAKVALQIFYLVLRDAGRDHNQPGSPGYGSYDSGFAAIAALFGNSTNKGDITTRARDIRTKSGGSISLLAPGGGLTLTTSNFGSQLAPPGVITEAGGDISIFTHGSVDIGISRIFTLRGGSQIIWSSTGDIAAGSSSKTVQSAPPTRVLIDPQSAALKVDLAGLATGGGIGVLATVGGVPPGSVDLIAPEGVVDAGDAGIQATGDLNIAAVQVLNADNISAGGTVAGVPAAPVAAVPNIAGLTAASNSAGATTSAANDLAQKSREPATQDETPSVITVEVLGYGGGEDAAG